MSGKDKELFGIQSSFTKRIVMLLHTIVKSQIFQVHSLLVNKVTCREYKVREKGGKGFGCPSKKEEEGMLLFRGGQQAGQT